MASATPLDTVLRRFRALPPLRGEGGVQYRQETIRAHRALGVAIANFVDAVRVDPAGTYEGSLVGLGVMVAALPEPPKLDAMDLVEIDGLGPKVIEP